MTRQPTESGSNQTTNPCTFATTDGTSDDCTHGSSSYSAHCCSGLLSLLINANEVWAARQLGVRVGYWQLPWLLAKTQAPFKRQAFRLLRSVVSEKRTQREKSSD